MRISAVVHFLYIWYISGVLEIVLSDLYLGPRIKELFELPSSLEFVRDYVAKNIPVIIRSGALSWPAITKWNSQLFR